MPLRDLPNAPFKIGQEVVVVEPNIKPWRGTVHGCKPTRSNGWWVSFIREGCEFIVHQSLVFDTAQVSR